jgi:hypothetical protein
MGAYLVALYDALIAVICAGALAFKLSSGDLTPLDYYYGIGGLALGGCFAAGLFWAASRLRSRSRGTLEWAALGIISIASIAAIHIEL